MSTRNPPNKNSSSCNGESAQPLLNTQVSAGDTCETVDPLPADIDDATSNKALKRGYAGRWRRLLQEFLFSRTQHFCVLTLVAIDLLCIFADIFINLYTCEEGKPSPTLSKARNGLATAGLVFSCLFMAELMLSIWAFGWRYFTSYFHTLDAIVILAGFVVDVLLHGVLEEIASLVIVLRLWRFFRIFEEFSVAAEERADALELHIRTLQSQNARLAARLAAADPELRGGCSS